MFLCILFVFMSYRMFHGSVRNGKGESSLSCEDDCDSIEGAFKNRSLFKVYRMYIIYLIDTIAVIVYILILPEQEPQPLETAYSHIPPHGEHYQNSIDPPHLELTARLLKHAKEERPELRASKNHSRSAFYTPTILLCYGLIEGLAMP